MLELDDPETEVHRWPAIADSRSRVVGVLLVHRPSGIAVVEASASTFGENREIAERRLRAMVASSRAIEAVAEALLARDGAS
jgi:hypothetical protein